MRSWTLALLFTALSLSGCATKGPALVGGVEDLIRLPSGTVIENVAIPGGQPQNIKTVKPGLWLSLDAWNRYEHTKGNGQ